MSEAQASSPRPARPLSPHLQIYKPQLTSVLSILHRLTGVGLFFGAVLLVVWLCAAARGPESYITMLHFLGSPFGTLLLMGWSWALFYHLCTGLRHLMWDVGAGLDLPTTYLTGALALIASVALTLLSWIVAFVFVL